MDKINVAELLKDCPKGMELDCTMFENVTFVRVDMSRKQFPIEIAVGGIRSKYLTKEGCFHDTILSPESKCVIFPKGKITWEGFVPPCKFKDGDIVTCNNCVCTFISLFKEQTTKKSFKHYCSVILDNNKFIVGIKYADYANARFATEEEKQKLFDAIKENGYKWNAETKTLEKLIEPKFTVGDRIKNRNNCRSSIVVAKEDDCFIIKTLDGLHNSYLTDKLHFSKQDGYELVIDKFNINTLKPFDEVLVRGNAGQKWIIDFFGFMDNNKGYPFVCVGHYVTQCIPYKGNEHLLSTTNDCDEFYKTWE